MNDIVTPSQVMFARYLSFEGPMFRGRYVYKLPANPKFLDKCMAVIAATEGKLDAINMYDKCICSVGCLQLCEGGLFFVSSLLGNIIEMCGPDVVLKPLEPAMKSSNVSFKKFDKLGWKFVFNDEKGIVNSTEKQREMFLKCSGLVGTWNDNAREHAKLWASCMANIFNDERARNVQIEFNKSKLQGFVSPSVSKDFFKSDDGDPLWREVATAIYISYAANNPTWAARAYLAHAKRSLQPKFTKNWTIELTKALVYENGIKIYPIRYNAIRPVVESIWHVELPKSADDLKTWEPNEISKVYTVEDKKLYIEDSVVTKDLNIKENKVKEITNVQDEQGSSILKIIMMIVRFFAALFQGKK